MEVHVLAEGGQVRKHRSVKDLPFDGMWADRGDITGGVSYVNNLRSGTLRAPTHTMERHSIDTNV